MRKKHKGVGIILGQGLTRIKQVPSNVDKLVAHAADGLPVRPWKTLVVPVHPRQAEIDFFKSLPSGKGK